MANKLSFEKKTSVVAMLCEGASIRGIERMTGVNRNTIMSLGLRMGDGCQKIMDEKLRNLNCKRIEVDEVWGFIGMKQKTAKLTRAGADMGDVWTWIALDPETKLVPTFAVGDRNQYMANCFIEDLAARLSHRIQITSDALILETFRNQKVWEGVVESFGLTGHPKAKRCYAWSYQDKGETQYVTALEIPPVESPITAVRVSIVADSKKWNKQK